MTTIAWDGTTLAVDSYEVSDDCLIDKNSKKILRIKNKAVSGAGPSSCCELFNQWVRDGMPNDDKPDLSSLLDKDDEFNGILLTPQSLFECDQSLVLIPIVYPYTWGSGWKWAMAAMDFGCDASESIKYAAKRDPFTGGRVRSINQKDLRK